MKDIVFHVHIPKTAGSFVRDALIDSGHVVVNRFVELDRPDDGLVRGHYSKEIATPGGTLLAGHFKADEFFFFRLFKRTRYIAVIREPFDWVCSLYFYVLRREHHYMHSLARSGFEGFFSHKDMLNMQSRYVAGRPLAYLNKLGFLSDNLLSHIAVMRAKKGFTCVASQEHLGYMFSTLRKKGLMKSDNRGSGSVNVNKLRPESIDVDSSTKEKFKKLYAPDYELYSWAFHHSKPNDES